MLKVEHKTGIEKNETNNRKVKYLQIENGILIDCRRNNIEISGMAEKIFKSNSDISICNLDVISTEAKDYHHISM